MAPDKQSAERATRAHGKHRRQREPKRLRQDYAAPDRCARACGGFFSKERFPHCSLSGASGAQGVSIGQTSASSEPAASTHDTARVRRVPIVSSGRAGVRPRAHRQAASPRRQPAPWRPDSRSSLAGNGSWSSIRSVDRGRDDSARSPASSRPSAVVRSSDTAPFHESCGTELTFAGNALGRTSPSLATRPKSAAGQDQLGRSGPNPLSQRNRTRLKRRREGASRLEKGTANPVGVVRTTSEGSSISKDPG